MTEFVQDNALATYREHHGRKPLMTTESDDVCLAVRKLRRQEANDGRVLFVATFPMFLCLALVDRALPWHWGQANDPQVERTSVFADARRKAEAILPMTYLT